jgi:hypothetical protein
MDGLRLDDSFHPLSKELSRVRIREAHGNNLGMPAIQHFASHGLGIMSLVIEQKTSPRSLNSTFSNLADLEIYVHTKLCPEPLSWLPSFSDRHPHLKRIRLVLWRCKRPALTWEALKNIPVIKPLYDAVQKCGLLWSFYLGIVTLARNSDHYALYQFTPTEVNIAIDAVDLTLDILRCLSPFIKYLDRLALAFGVVAQGQTPVIALVSHTNAVSSLVEKLIIRLD